MKFKPDHRMEFHCVNDDKIDLPLVLNPCFLYKEGDEFIFYNILREEEPRLKFRVTDIKHEIHSTIDGEQVIVVYVEKVGDK